MSPWTSRRSFLALIFALGLAGGCGAEEGTGEPDDGPVESEEGSDEGAAGEAGGEAGGPETPSITVGQPSALEVPAPPSFALEIESPGEYRVDALGTAVDPELFLFLGEELVAQDDDGGDGLNSRVVRFLAAGSYSLRVAERRGRSFTAQVQVQRLEPPEPVGAVSAGHPLQVQFPPFPLLRRPGNDRAAAKSVTFEVGAAGEYTCHASSTPNRSARMAIIHEGAVIAEDTDGHDARITHELATGTHRIRVWDVARRGDMVITVSCEAGAGS